MSLEALCFRTVISDYSKWLTGLGNKPGSPTPSTLPHRSDRYVCISSFPFHSQISCQRYRFSFRWQLGIKDSMNKFSYLISRRRRPHPHPSFYRCIAPNVRKTGKRSQHVDPGIQLWFGLGSFPVAVDRPTLSNYILTLSDTNINRNFPG